MASQIKSLSSLELTTILGGVAAPKGVQTVKHVNWRVGKNGKLIIKKGAPKVEWQEDGIQGQGE